jgi:hypothetical protein
MPDQALLIHFSVESIPTILQMLNITAFCLKMYRRRRKVSSSKAPCNFLGKSALKIRPMGADIDCIQLP